MIKFFPDMKTFIEIFGVGIAWYAVLIMTGAFVAYYLSLRNIKKMGFEADDLDTLFVGVLGFGILGARLWYVLFFDFGTYLKNPLSILMFRDGGLAIHGGLFAGVAFGYFYLKHKGYNFLQWADAILPNVMVAQALGRWGNFMNQEAYGGVVSESHFRFLPDFIKNNMFINGQYRAPTFLYESVLNLIGWVLITQVLKRSKKLKRGDLSFAYLIWYGVIRFIIEAMRDDALLFHIGGIEFRIAQVISVIFVVVGLIGFYGGFKRFYPKTKPVILFDFDGTIMDTQDVIFESYKHVFKKHKPDFELTDDILYSFLGPTLWDSFGQYFEKDRIDDLVSEYREINMSLHDTLVKPMDHVIEVLDTLKSQGYKMGIVSSKLYEPIITALKMFDMEDYFEVIYGMDNYDKVKPDPDGILKAMDAMFYDRSSFIYIGDSKTDIEAGKNAGAFTIGTVFDKNREQEIIDANPNVIIDDWRELLEVLEGDHEWTYNMI